MTEEKQKITMDVISDVMCPWCYIGQKNLEAATKLASELDVEVTWRPYQLDATLPPKGKNRQQYLNDKFGGQARANEIYGRINQAGKSVGIDFKFDLMKVSPNTLDAHRLISWAGAMGNDIQNKLVTRLFEMFFLEGINIGDHKILIETAKSVGMDEKQVAESLKGDQDKELVQQQIAKAHQIGVTGVPYFIVNNKYALSGAQPAASIAQAMRHAAGEAAEEAAYTS